MRKQVRILRIDPELQALSSPISTEEYRELEDSIQLNGCLEPLTVWNRTIVDGYKRYAICVKYSIPFAVERIDFDSRDTAAGWLIERQLSMPGLGAYELPYRSTAGYPDTSWRNRFHRCGFSCCT